MTLIAIGLSFLVSISFRFDGARGIRKGAVDAVAKWVESLGGTVPPEVRAVADRVGDEGATPLAVAECEGEECAAGSRARVLVIIVLKALLH